jgi:hypothetical protein
MADDPKKNPTEQSGQEQDPEQRQKDQQDISKRNPTRQDQDENQDDQQQGGQRRAS